MSWDCTCGHCIALPCLTWPQGNLILLCSPCCRHTGHLPSRYSRKCAANVVHVAIQNVSSFAPKSSAVPMPAQVQTTLPSSGVSAPSSHVDWQQHMRYAPTHTETHLSTFFRPQVLGRDFQRLPMKPFHSSGDQKLRASPAAPRTRFIEGTVFLATRPPASPGPAVSADAWWLACFLSRFKN